MTEKQKEKIKTKIKKIKSTLVADKISCGGYYDDSRGLRYASPRLYIQLGDFLGGLRYMNWFDKNFPDDSCYPDFLFEWTIILFKSGKLKEAEKKAFQAFSGNTYLFDKFFNKETILIDKLETTNLEVEDFAKSAFDYIHMQDNLTDFTEWLKNLIISEKYKQQSN